MDVDLSSEHVFDWQKATWEIVANEASKTAEYWIAFKTNFLLRHTAATAQRCTESCNGSEFSLGARQARTLA